MNQSNAAGTCWLCLPITSPFAQYQFFEGINADTEGIRKATLRLVWDIHAPPTQVLGINLVRMSAS